MWGMLESLRKLTSLTIISIRLPPLTTVINRSLLQFSQVDILPTDKIEEYFIEFDDEEDTPLSQSFESAGFGSRNSLRNLGSTFIYIISSFFYYSMVFTLNLFVSTRQGYFALRIKQRQSKKSDNKYDKKTILVIPYKNDHPIILHLYSFINHQSDLGKTRLIIKLYSQVNAHLETSWLTQLQLPFLQLSLELLFCSRSSFQTDIIFPNLKRDLVLQQMVSNQKERIALLLNCCKQCSPYLSRFI
ncbi:hypothetical protein FGO68_gene7769 [Halteria grandinella]|uniref:Uncharacterized protein n=1 Tax=Halteria grandinella TaxID=5974 RepID=A0A8J8NDZ3_HALGN|nr:hypothetical protein FGO68_gene7769 [Halteria grandinella]